MVCPLTTPLANLRVLTCLPEKAKSIIRKSRLAAGATQAKSVNDGLIPRPPGRQIRDFNIFEEMKAKGRVEISKETYKKLIVSQLDGPAYHSMLTFGDRVPSILLSSPLHLTWIYHLENRTWWRLQRYMHMYVSPSNILTQFNESSL